MGGKFGMQNCLVCLVVLSSAEYREPVDAPEVQHLQVGSEEVQKQT